MGRPKIADIWKHYRVLANKAVICRYCEKQYKIGNVNKMGAHLINCFKCPLIVKQVLTKKRSEVQLHKNFPQQSLTEDLPSTDSFTTSSLVSPNSSLLSEENRSNLTKQLAKAIFVTGSPLSMVEHPLWVKFFEELQPSYKLPTRKAIATTHLDRIYSEMRKELNDELNGANYLHLQCDGWSNIRNEGIINFLISKPEPVFIESLNTEYSRHTGQYLSEQILKVMKTYGEKKFVALIGDNAKNMQKAFKMVKDTHPHVIPLGCAAHTLNLLSQDCMKCETVKAFIEVAVNIIKTIKRSQVLSALLNKIIKDKGTGENLKLPCKTRWGSYVFALKSLYNTKVALQTLAVHENIQLPLERKSTLLDENFWDMTQQCITILEPITEWIFKLEGNEYNISNVFIAFKDIKSKLELILPTIEILNDKEKEEILASIDRRTTDCVKTIHLAAYMLDPKTQGVQLDQTQEVQAMEFVFNMSRDFNFDVMPDIANYKAKEGLWGKQFVWSNLEDISPVVWWKGICGSTQLSKVAVRILTAPCTSAATERSFSVQGNIHNKKRNRLTAERAAKITFISYNWNLLHKHEYCEDNEDLLNEETSIVSSNM